MERGKCRRRTCREVVPLCLDAGLAFGAPGRTRTDKLSLAGDFESPVSTNSTTGACEALHCAIGVTLPAAEIAVRSGDSVCVAMRAVDLSGVRFRHRK